MSVTELTYNTSVGITGQRDRSVCATVALCHVCLAKASSENTGEWGDWRLWKWGMNSNDFNANMWPGHTFHWKNAMCWQHLAVKGHRTIRTSPGMVFPRMCSPSVCLRAAHYGSLSKRSSHHQYNDKHSAPALMEPPSYCAPRSSLANLIMFRHFSAAGVWNIRENIA